MTSYLDYLTCNNEDTQNQWKLGRLLLKLTKECG